MVCRSCGFSFSRLKGLGGLDFLEDLLGFVVEGWLRGVREGPPPPPALEEDVGEE